MCGIVCAYNDKIEIEGLRSQLLSMSKQIRHRGPDWSGIHVNKHAICLLYTSPSPRDGLLSRMPSSA